MMCTYSQEMNIQKKKDNIAPETSNGTFTNVRTFPALSAYEKFWNCFIGTLLQK